MSDDPRVGTELAGYRIESLLGFGGMSVVYLAEDLRLKRRVALKLLARDLAEDESFRDRFLRESELAASIDHPNIVPIYEAGTTGDLLFIAMRYVEGRDLKERMQRGRLDPGDATGILAQVASALDAAHGRGLVHRDVKPSNVLLDKGARPDGSDHVYLADFGLTLPVAGDAAIGEDGTLLGTVDYVAPEQIAGGEIDGRADVYSLGCMLYECLVGQPPFGRDSELAVVFAHLDEEAPLPSAERPELPVGLDAVVARALAKDPGRRYESCGELARAALAVTVEEARRRLAEVASRAAAGRSELGEVEAELAGKVTDLQLAREQARALAVPALPAGAAAEGVCPFKGLASFEPVDADYFFGRERLVAELVARLVGGPVLRGRDRLVAEAVARLVGAPFLGIVGPSGSGKSSVLRAGLLPALAGGALPGSEGWRRVLLRPGERPMDELRRVLVSGAEDPLAEALDALPAGGRLLIAVDQLEELHTACRSEEERVAFTDTLARAAADRKGRAVVVVALRADFYGRFAGYAALAELLSGNQVLVGPMQASELRRAVERPAARVGLRVEPELVDALVDDVEGEPGALPLLSTALLELWQKRQDNTLALASYRESGGVHGAVARLAEGTYARFPDERKPLVRALLLRLVGEGEGDAAVRRRAPLAELELEQREDVAAVLARLADSRLVTVGEGTVEVAHEALLREWPRLREWIEEDAEGRRLRRRITQAATEWDAAGREEGELYRGARLAAALEWSTDHAFELNEVERAFVSESRDTSEQEARKARRTNNRLRALLAGVAVLLVAAVAGGVFAVVQRGQARGAETAQLAQRLGAQALVEEDFDLSLLLARQAVAIDDTAQTRGYLLAALLRAPQAIGIVHADSDFEPVLRGLAVTPDGKTLAIADPFVGAVVVDTRTFERRGDPIAAPPMVEAVAYDPDGETLAIGGSGYVRLFDAQTRAQVAGVTLGARTSALRLTFTRDGSRLVVLESTGEHGSGWVTVRDAETLRQIGSRIEPEGFTGSWISQYWTHPDFAVTPDGRSLVTTSVEGELAWWNLASGEKTRTIKIERGHRALGLSADGRRAAIGLDRGLRVIDLRTGAAREARGALASRPIGLRFSPDGETIVSTNTDGTVVLWDAVTATPGETLRGHSRSVWWPVFSPDGETLYTASSDATAMAWDLGGDRGLGRRFTFTHDRGLSDWPDRHPGKFSPDGRLIAVGLKGKGVQLWDAGEVAPLGQPLVQTLGEVKGLAFSRDGRTLAAASTSGTTVWDVPSRSRRFALPSSGAWGVSINADGTRLATASWDGTRVWSLTTGAELGRIVDAAVGDIAFSPTEPILALVYEGWGYEEGRSIGPIDGGGDVELWDVTRQSLLATLEVDTKPGSEDGYALGWTMAFSQDGRTLATGGGDPLVHIWDVRRRKLVGELEQNVGNAVWGLDFSADGSILAMSGGDSFSSLWDVATGTQIGPRIGAGSRESMLDLSADGRRLLMTSGNGQGAIWEIDPESWPARACGLVNRRLTSEEWKEFLPGRPYAPACST